jgi:hypothetical protein
MVLDERYLVVLDDFDEDLPLGARGVPALPRQFIDARNTVFEQRDVVVLWFKTAGIQRSVYLSFVSVQSLGPDPRRAMRAGKQPRVGPDSNQRAGLSKVDKPERSSRLQQGQSAVLQLTGCDHPARGSGHTLDESAMRVPARIENAIRAVGRIKSIEPRSAEMERSSRYMVGSE